MTLNIVLGSPRGVYLSADFRISDQWPGGVIRPRLPDDLDVQKLVPIVRRRWAGLVAYTGNWAFPPATPDVGAWIGERVDAVPNDGAPHDLVQRLLREANALLANAQSNIFEIAFSFVGFERRHAFAHLMSNFLEHRYRRIAPERMLRPSLTRPKEPVVHSPGDLISGPERASLLEVLSGKPPGSTKIHNLLAQTNAVVASRLDTVSAPCVTGYVGVTGDVSIRPHDIPPGRYFPRFVQKDFENIGMTGFEPRLDPQAQPLPPRWIEQAARFDSTQGRAVTAHIMRGVGPPIGGGAVRPGMQGVWKVAGPDEPRTYTVTFHKTPTR